MSDSLADFWQKLQKVRRFSITASTGNWVGKGEVIIEHLSEKQLIFHEKGSWDSGISFTNTLSWIRQKDNIVLEHCRQGSRVFLVELVPIGPRLLSSEQPHLCRLDTYSAKVFWDDIGFSLEWECKGPKKNDLLHCRYL